MSLSGYELLLGRLVLLLLLRACFRSVLMIVRNCRLIPPPIDPVSFPTSIPQVFSRAFPT